MTTITALPTPPTREDPTNFAVRADAFLAALPTFATETNAVASETNTAKTNAETAATTATTQAGLATTARIAAELAETNAETAATAAQLAETNAEAAQAAAELALDQFTDLYLGPKAANPTLDNDGNALTEGSFYWNTSTKEIRFYNGTTWSTPNLSGTSYVALAGDQTIAGTKTFSSPISGSVTGNAATVTNGVYTSIPLVSGSNLNSAVTSGFYRLADTHTNWPSAEVAFGQMIVSRGGDTIVQIITGYSNGRMWFRHGNSSDVGGTGAWTAWRLLGGNDAVNVISGNTTAAPSQTYVLTASLTLTLPASPIAGDLVKVVNRSGTTTPVVARNGSNIMGLAEDLTLDSANAPVTLVYADATRGWVIS